MRSSTYIVTTGTSDTGSIRVTGGLTEFVTKGTKDKTGTGTVEAGATTADLLSREIEGVIGSGVETVSCVCAGLRGEFMRGEAIITSGETCNMARAS